MSVFNDLVSATRQRRLVRLYYGDATRPRVCQPHILFEATTGKTCLDVVQVSGETSRHRSLPGWRQFHVDRIRNLEVLDRTFRPDPALDVTNPRYATIYARC